MKVHYIPTQIYPTQATPHIGSMWKVDDATGYNGIAAVPNDKLLQMPGFKALDPTRQYSKYFSFKKLSTQMNVAWQDASAYNPGQENELTRAITMFRFQILNPSVDVIWGTFKTTWYVKMRG